MNLLKFDMESAVFKHSDVSIHDAYVIPGGAFSISGRTTGIGLHSFGKRGMWGQETSKDKVLRYLPEAYCVKRTAGKRKPVFRIYISVANQTLIGEATTRPKAWRRASECGVIKSMIKMQESVTAMSPPLTTGRNPAPTSLKLQAVNFLAGSI